MNNNGWIKLHRSFLDWEWYSDINVTRLFMHCLLRANHKPAKYRGTVIASGQFTSSQDVLAKETGLSVRQIRTALDKLKSTGELTVKTNNKFSMISITNWSEYQDSDSQDVNEKAGQRQADDSPMTTNKNVKKKKNVKNKDLDFSGWPEMPNDQTMTDWLDMRKRLKANVTQTVINNFSKQLILAVDLGFSVDQCISECCARNWKGFKLEWIQNAQIKPIDRAGQKANVNDFIDQAANSAADRFSGNAVQEVHSNHASEVASTVHYGSASTIEHE